MKFLERTRGIDFCEGCGEKIRWIQLISGMWIAVQEAPILYVPGKGKMWLVEYRRRDAQIMKDCLIYRRGLGIDPDELVKGYEPHVFRCGK